jgi:signal transduction histidine kinase
LTDKKRLQNKTEEKIEKIIIDRMGQISSELAHDLRSPLQTIQNAVYLIERDTDNPVYYKMIRESLSQITEILDSFRDYYKGHLLTLIESDLEKVYLMTKSNFEIPSNITLAEDIDKLKKFKMDPVKISKVIHKLLKNAIEAIPNGGEINVKIKNYPDQVFFSIQDNGSGISQEVQNVIFTPFESKKKKGRGLGIPASKRIIESHGGALTYRTKEGEGTTFSFNLPKN